MINPWEALSSTLKNKLIFNKMIETQLAQIAAALPAIESGKIPGQPETSVENVSMVSTRWSNSFRRPPCTNHAGRYNPPRNDVWDGMVAALQEDPGVPMISCSIYIKHFEQCLYDLGASVNIMPKVIYEELQYPALSPNNDARTACRTHLHTSTRFLHPCQFCGNGYGGRPRSRPRTWATFHKVR